MSLGQLLSSLFILTALSLTATAEDGSAAWLRYAPIAHREQYRTIPRRIVVYGGDPVELSAAHELQKGLSSMLGEPFMLVRPGDHPGQAAIVLASSAGLGRSEQQSASLPQGDSYSVRWSGRGKANVWLTGGTPRAELYAAFHLLEEVATEATIPFAEVQSPAAPIRWVDQWDNFDGTIERGYAGPSIFFADGHVRSDLTRAGQYARLLASIGLNGCTVNNVNADLQTLSTDKLHELARIADAFRPWGISLSLAIDLSSPQVVGGLKTFDPNDPDVAAWWQKKVDEVYTIVPDLAGFVVKADSEGRAGPSQYGRTPAEAANVLARALAPHHGLVLYRGFVYNHHLDYNDLKADRARAGYDNFHALDGKFEPNVVIQIKHGPIDFQVREPVSPLFAGLQHTNEAIELQTTQEYTGQQRHMVFLVPMWKTALDTDLRVRGRSTPLKTIVTGKSFHRPLGGFVSVVNVGLDANWMHHPLALANLYGFGRLAWNPDATSVKIIDTWTRLTFGNDANVVATIGKLQLESWRTYEDYTGPLGLQTLTNILGYHFGPGVGTADHNGWGQWIRADHNGLGMDRTVATGTAYIGQYPPGLAHVYEDLATCPDDLLLFMHHVPYTYVLHSGKTVIQTIYDLHDTGATIAASFVTSWELLNGRIDAERYKQVDSLLHFQQGHAIVWRDAITKWFHSMSGIDDTAGRVGQYPDRIEAESMKSDGYRTVDVMPVETASGGKAVVCERKSGCSVSTIFHGRTAQYRLRVGYFDLRSGVSSYELRINHRVVATWLADDILPPAQDDPNLDGQTATRFAGPTVGLQDGDSLEIRASPDGHEPAALDYLELSPEPNP